MSGIKEMAKLTNGLEDRLIVLMRRGMCQSVCDMLSQAGDRIRVKHPIKIYAEGI